MKSLIGLTEQLLRDAELASSTDLARDLITIKSRVEHEGLSFLTISLPNFCDWLEAGLEEGRALDTIFSSFARKGGTSLPKFLSGLTERVFQRDGFLLPPCPEQALSVSLIRQICRMFKKLEVECSPERVEQAIAAYETCEQELRVHVKKSSSRTFQVVSNIIISSTTSGFDAYSIVPKHGPGAVVEKLDNNSKFTSLKWGTRLDREFPMDRHLFLNEDWATDESGINSVEVLGPSDEPPSRVITVPKTLKAPRVIAVEPVYQQYIQQGILEWLVPKIETSSITGGHINFAKQSINANLALTSSESRRYATMDLSEASDRLLASVVSDMLAVHPDLRRAVFACRTSRAKLPNGRILPLKKFASMGSALCFPMEALAFFIIAVASILDHRGLAPTYRNIFKVSRDVYVYGDDLVLPVDEVEVIAKGLESFGLKVNRKKTFSKGYFRESCGTDAYFGIPVTPVYCRRPLLDKRDTKGLVSWVSLSNQLYRAGYWRAASFVKKEVEQHVGALPCVAETSPGLGWFSYQGYQTQKWDDNLHRPLVYTVVTSPSKRESKIDGHAALMKTLMRWNPMRDVKHLESIVSRDALRRKRRWTTPF